MKRSSLAKKLLTSRHDKAVMEVNKEMNGKFNWPLIITWGFICMVIAVIIVVGFFYLWN